ncbi:MAG: DNA gyrase inhibitor YacG [Sphingomonadaceae bacterium]|nr:DNA gyrase inhibitor YacG [Sphingomonadaceae bacterium]
MSPSNTPDRCRRELCPLCGAPAAAEHVPFCSRGCRDRDLLNWLGEGYRAADPEDVENADARLDSTPEPPL